MNIFKQAFASIVLSAFLVSCGGGGDKKENQGQEAQQLSGSISIDGSSTVEPISSAAAEIFSSEKAEGVTIKVNASGTGGGFKKFIRKEIDIADASRPIKKPEDSACKAAGIEYIELPIAYDGLAVVVNPQNTWVDKLTVAELKKIWEPAAQGKVMKWSQVRKGWPDIDIKLYGAGTSSGTFEYFTEAINGKSKESRADYSGNEDDNVLVQGVAGDKGALGYFGLYYFTANQDKLKIVPIDDEKDENGKGGIVPSDETVRNGTYQPLSRPLFIYVGDAAAKRPEVDAFVNFYIDNAERLVKEAKYIPINKEVYSKIKERFAKRVKGSVFVNLETAVGVKLDEILKLEK